MTQKNEPMPYIIISTLNIQGAGEAYVWSEHSYPETWEELYRTITKLLLEGEEVRIGKDD